MRSYISISLLSSSLVSDWMQRVRRILLRGQCPFAAEKILKIWLRNGAFWSISEYICGQHSAVLYTCLPWCSQNIQKTAVFSLFNFSSIFHGGQLTQFAPMCGRPYDRMRVTSCCCCCCWSESDVSCTPVSWGWLSGRAVLVECCKQTGSRTERRAESTWPTRRGSNTVYTSSTAAVKQQYCLVADMLHFANTFF